MEERLYWVLNRFHLRKNSHWFALSFALLLLFSPLSTVLAAPGDATVTVGSQPATVKPGDQLTVTLSINGERCSATAAADVVLVIDHSGSMITPLTGVSTTRGEAANNAANGFIETFIQNPNNKVRAVFFDDTAEEVQISNGRLVNPLAPRGNTIISSGLNLATQLLSGSTGAKAIILLTDGYPEGESASNVQATAAATKAAGITLFTIGFGIDQVRGGEDLLRSIASSPNAPYYYTAPLVQSELNTIYNSIATVTTQSSRLGTAGVITENFDAANFDFVSADFGGQVTSPGVITFNLPQVNTSTTLSYVLRAKNNGTFQVTNGGNLSYTLCDTSTKRTVLINPFSLTVGTPPPPTPAPPTKLPNTGPGDSILFTVTGFRMSGTFYNYWILNGGLSIFGYPIDSEKLENGQVYQWLERNRFELHPENKAPYNVLLGRLGAEVLQRNGVNWNDLPKVGSAPAVCRYFAETGHSLCSDFLNYWNNNGLQFEGTTGKTYAESLALFGFPISEPKMETNSSGDTVLTQWFERARFEYHPNNPDGSKVLLGRLGAELK